MLANSSLHALTDEKDDCNLESSMRTNRVQVGMFGLQITHPMAHLEDIAFLLIGSQTLSSAKGEVICSGKENSANADAEKRRMYLRRSCQNASTSDHS